jgi:D-alanine-D-alanine ligase
VAVSNSNPLRVLLLSHPDLVPPPEARSADSRRAPWKAEFDVLQALASLGHETKILGVYDSVDELRRHLDEWRPHIVFNLLEEFDGVATFDQNIVSYLELARVPYTGCNPRGLMLARQKALAKMVLAHQGVRTPEFEVFPRGQYVKAPEDFRSPWFVKSLTEEASLGISQDSIVRTPKSFVERIRFIQEKIGSDALAERYIPGRELYVGVTGNQRLEAFPIWELKFRKAPKELPRIATRRVKFDLSYQKKYGITSGPAVGLDEISTRRIHLLSKRIYSALGLNGYGRLDLRLTDEGELYFLEANPNPHIGREEDFAQSALKAGLSYRDLVERILRLGLRWQPRRLAA